MQTVPATSANAVPAIGTRNPGIDLLRGLAIVLVVFNHLGLRIPLKKTALTDVLPAWLLSRLNYNGYEAVFVFFVISGFLISGNALRRWGSLEKIDLRAFYARRFARIVPCLLALVAVLSMLHLAGVRDYTILHANQSLPRAIFAALGLHLNWYEGQTGYLPGNWDVLWSLSIEEVFYLGFPLVCLLTRRRRVLVPWLALLALSMPWTHAALRGNEIWQEKAYLPGMSAIAIGVLGALLADAWRPPRRTVVMLGWFGATGLGAVLLDGGALWHWLRDGYMLVLTLSSLCLVLCCRWRTDGGAALSLPGFGWLRSWGRLSYEIYLTHMFAVFAVVRAYRAWGGDPAHGWLWYLPALGLCWLLGAVVERWLSTPYERWLRRCLWKPAGAARPTTAELPVA
ncbi:acyltransferase [Rhodanobacter denitrificans]|uniref:acyltransferase family protein n=1 Tax=Rhodanobacter denitrificans TaxID=666685 RepID=UPI000260CC2B|nr:acyltransferase [Rhodanobacter denitrificans]EIM04814.1 lipopolysaccharide modification acyltransferase [Rhodanobacter denitrificans]UJM89855.1 acyltransferase [Rhodanobacter denitrificans]